MKTQSSFKRLRVIAKSKKIKNKKQGLMRKVKYISITPQQKKEISAEIGCCLQAVYNALSYKTDGDLAGRVRSLAMKKGGFIAYLNSATL